MKVLVLLTGGCESTAYLCHAVEEGYEVDALHVSMSNVSDQEGQVSRLICDKLGVSYYEMKVDADDFFQYATRTIRDTNYWIFAAVLAAGRMDYDEIWFGIHCDDNLPQVGEVQSIYNLAVKQLGGSDYPPLRAPLFNLSKQELYDSIRVDIKPELVYCQVDKLDPCGQCGKCEEWKQFVKGVDKKVQ